MFLRKVIGLALLVAVCPLVVAQEGDQAKPVDPLEAAWKKVNEPVEFIKDLPRPKSREEYLRVMKRVNAGREQVKKNCQAFLKEHGDKLKSGVGFYYAGLAQKALGEYGKAATALKAFRKAMPKHEKALSAGMQLISSLRGLASYKGFKEMEKLCPKLKEEMVAANAMRKYGRTLSQIAKGLESTGLRWSWNGKPFPKIKVENVVGADSFSMEALKGKVVIVDFWATWCGPCRKIIPKLVELKKEYGSKGLEIVGLTRYYGSGWELTENKKGSLLGKSAGRDLSKEKELELNKIFHKGVPLNYPIVISDGTLGKKMGIRGIPTLFLVDRKGNVYWHKVGSGGEEKLVKKVKELLIKKSK